jgi:hypothetical protein
MIAIIECVTRWRRAAAGGAEMAIGVPCWHATSQAHLTIGVGRLPVVR